MKNHGSREVTGDAEMQNEGASMCDELCALSFSEFGFNLSFYNHWTWANVALILCTISYDKLQPFAHKVVNLFPIHNIHNNPKFN